MNDTNPLIVLQSYDEQENNTANDFTQSVQSLNQKLIKLFNELQIPYRIMPKIIGQTHPKPIGTSAIIYKNKAIVMQNDDNSPNSHYEAHIRSFLNFQQKQVEPELFFTGSNTRPKLNPGPESLICDHTAYFMSNQDSHHMLADVFKQRWNLRVVELTLKPEYQKHHLNACFKPITSAHAMCHLQAFDKPSQKKLIDEFEIIDIEADDFEYQAIKAMVLGEEIIIPKYCEQTAHNLQEAGFIARGIDFNPRFAEKFSWGISDFALAEQI